MWKFSLAALCGLILGAVSLSAAPMFTQCPAVGSNTGCQFLLVVAANGTFTIQQDTNAPNNGPYDGSDDTLVGVQNNSASTITSLVLASTATSNGGIYNFEGDGPCTQSVKPASCPASGNFPGDPTGYGGPGVSFSNINAALTSGTINFAGIAPGGSAWFGLEDTPTLASFVPGPVGGGGTPAPSGVPEPASFALMGGGLAALLFAARRRKLAAAQR